MEKEIIKRATPLDDELVLKYNGNWLYVKDADEPGSYIWDDANVVCQAKGTGCHLPDDNELSFLYQNKDEIGCFDKYYWSSSEYDSDKCWVQNFYDGSLSTLKKNSSGKVRCVRTDTKIGTINLNKITMEQVVEYLKDKNQFKSSGEAACINRLIEFYENNK